VFKNIIVLSSVKYVKYKFPTKHKTRKFTCLLAERAGMYMYILLYRFLAISLHLYSPFYHGWNYN